MELNIIFYIITVILVLAASIQDLRTGKISNRLTKPAILAGPVLNLCVYGVRGLESSLAGILVGAVLILFFAVRILGAGDVKLYMAVGALMGWRFCLFTMMWSILAGGVAGVVILFLRKNWKERFLHLWLYIKRIFITGKFRTYETMELGNQGYFSFGACIGAGVVLTIILQKTGYIHVGF